MASKTAGGKTVKKRRVHVSHPASNEGGLTTPAILRVPRKRVAGQTAKPSSEPASTDSIFFGPLTILGMQTGITLEVNETNAKSYPTFSTTVAAPEGTTNVFTSIERVLWGYGTLTTGADGSTTMSNTFGHSLDMIAATASGTVDSTTSPPTVTIDADAFLTDQTLSRAWAVQLVVSVLFLGGPSDE